MDKTDVEELSERYYAFMDDFAQNVFEDSKLLGKYYTDYTVASRMADLVCAAFCRENNVSESLSVIDPFCGDGRLILCFLKSWEKSGRPWPKHLSVSVWDIDCDAVATARKRIVGRCREAGVECDINAHCSDAFVAFSDTEGQYDICVTNPPWGLLKPQKTLSRHADKETMKEYKRALEEYDSYISAAFPTSRPLRKFGRWGTNLARCGTELALRLVHENGIAGIVSPASLFSDTISEVFRKWLFSNFEVDTITYYPPELKLYGNADISSVTFVARRSVRGTNESLEVISYSDYSTCENEKVAGEDFAYLRSSGFNVPLVNTATTISILRKLDALPTLQEYCQQTGLCFVRELDETRVKEKLLPSGNIKFAKGYMVDRYSFVGDSLYLDVRQMAPPVSCFRNKVVWRDVSRDSQTRRMKATLLSPGFICGNSLGVIYGDDVQLPYLKMVLAFMDSLIYEYQARSKLVSNHVSAGIVKQIRVPDIGIDDELVRLVDLALNGKDVQREIEVEVALLYGVDPHDFEVIVSSFSLGQDDQKDLIDSYSKRFVQGE